MSLRAPPTAASFEAHLIARKYKLIEIMRRKTYDTVVYSALPNVTRAELTLRCHVEELPWAAIHKIWPWRNWP